MAKTIRFEVVDAAVTNVNPRTENHGESVVVACDLNVDGIVDGEVLDQISAAGFAPFRGFLWDDSGRARSLGLSQLRFEGGFDDQAVTLTRADDAAIDLHDVRVRRFRARPLDERKIELSLQLQFGADDASWRWLRRALELEKVRIAFRAPAQTDPIDDAEHAARVGANGGAVVAA